MNSLTRSLTLLACSLAVFCLFIISPSLTNVRYAGSFVPHHDMIFNQEGPVDVVFFGTSRAMRAFYTKELMPLVEKKLGRPIVGYDLSHASRTADISYVMLRDLLEKRSVRLVVSEYVVTGQDDFHTLFPRIATYGDIFEAPFAGFDGVRTVGRLIRNKLSLMMALTNGLVPTPSQAASPIPAETTDKTAPSLARPSVIARRAASIGKADEVVLPLSDDWNWIQNEYTERTIALIEANGGKAIFLYLPAINQAQLKDGERERFLARFHAPIFALNADGAPVLEPSDYSDGKHMGWGGLRKINPYLAGIIADALGSRQ